MKNQIEYSWVFPNQLNNRIDTRPYKKWVLDYTEKCRKYNGQIIKLGNKKHVSMICRGIGGAKPEKANIAVYKAKEVTCYGIAKPEVFIDSCIEEKVLVDGDVLLTSSGIGTIGRAALFISENGDSKKSTVDNHVAIIRVSKKSQLISGYLVSFLNSKYGRSWSEWGTTGSTRLLELSPSLVSQFKIPVPNRTAQQYINTKIILAEKCRLEAKNLEAKAKKYLELDLGQSQHEILSDIKQRGILLNGGFFVAVDPTLLRNRLDPVGYHPELLELQKNFSKRRPVFQKLREIVNIVTNNRKRINTASSYYVSVLHVDNKGYLDRLAASSYCPESPGREVKVDDILVSCINPAANRIVVCDEMDGTIACSPEFAILKSKEFPSHYIAFVLRSDLVYRQIIHLGKGTSSSRRRIDEDELLDLEIPVVSKSHEIASLVKKRQFLIGRSYQLTNEAISDVESLIEEQLSSDAILSGELKAPTWEDIEIELEGI